MLLASFGLALSAGKILSASSTHLPGLVLFAVFVLVYVVIYAALWWATGRFWSVH